MPSTSVDGAQLDSVLLTGIVAHGLTLCICVGWTGWSVYRHGWRKRSTRRFSYYLYIVLHALRLCWLVALSHSGVEGTLDMSELDSPTAALLNRVALCIGHNAFSMVVFGWANVSAGAPGASGARCCGCVPAPSARRLFVVLNIANWASQAALLGVLLDLAPDGPSPRLAAWLAADVGLIAACAAVLSCAAAVFGVLLSARFVELAAAAADPSLGTYVSVKFNKINVAWHALCAAFALRAYALATTLPRFGPAGISRAHYYTFGYYVPDIVPTLVALVVLRKRATPCPYSGLCGARPDDGLASGLRQQLLFSRSLGGGERSAGGGGYGTPGGYGSGYGSYGTGGVSEGGASEVGSERSAASARGGRKSSGGEA